MCVTYHMHELFSDVLTSVKKVSDVDLHCTEVWWSFEYFGPILPEIWKLEVDVQL